MGLLDKVKQQVTDAASAVAEKTQETARAGQLQVQLRNLRTEEKEAFADFGREAYRLRQSGMLAEGSSELTAAGTRIADAQARIVEKEAEIAQARGGDETPTPEGTVESSAVEVDETPPAGDRPEGPAA
jgi:hypothetical protein